MTSVGTSHKNRNGQPNVETLQAFAHELPYNMGWLTVVTVFLDDAAGLQAHESIRPRTFVYSNWPCRNIKVEPWPIT